MTPPLVRFQNVRRSYDGIADAVHDLTLDVAQGELLTLLGPSGSGKTTTLMMLAGFEAPDGGTILLDGRDITRLAAHKRGIGVVFQNFSLFPHMTAAENVAFPLEVRRVAKSERAERVARALDMVRLAGLGERLPAQLSGGQQQRVALARALVYQPRLVLLDEPLGALDRALREEMQIELRHLHEQLGVTMLYVTHDQAEALTLADRIAVFAGGRLRQTGTPETLYEDPETAFVARFLGENNFLPGIALGLDEDLLEVRLDCGVTVLARQGDAPDTGRCVVAIRPERIAVAAIPAAEMGEGALPATLIEAIYLGDHIRLRLDIGLPGAAPVPITVKRPAGAPMTGLQPGGTASVAWQSYHARAFRPDPSV
jgi:putative spermidine/putrescine transport system ATP-binding protein